MDEMHFLINANPMSSNEAGENTSLQVLSELGSKLYKIELTCVHLNIES